MLPWRCDILFSVEEHYAFSLWQFFFLRCEIHKFSGDCMSFIRECRWFLWLFIISQRLQTIHRYFLSDRVTSKFNSIRMSFWKWALNPMSKSVSGYQQILAIQNIQINFANKPQNCNVLEKQLNNSVFTIESLHQIAIQFELIF